MCVCVCLGGGGGALLLFVAIYGCYFFDKINEWFIMAPYPFHQPSAVSAGRRWSGGVGVGYAYWMAA